mmetsp:Transcript_86438/g.268957  ORF Transcript_86438/g.268957 Transcript_86438/m.268957 type:complete len:222 (+) Transcript_86438:1108-1773(+)
MPRISLAKRSASSYFFMLTLIFASVSRASASPSFSLTSLNISRACFATFAASCFFWVRRCTLAAVLRVAASAALLPALENMPIASSAASNASLNLHNFRPILAMVWIKAASSFASLPLPSTCWAFAATSCASNNSPMPRWTLAMTCNAKNLDFVSFFLHAASKFSRADFIALSYSSVEINVRHSFTHGGQSFAISSKTRDMTGVAAAQASRVARCRPPPHP